VQKNRLFYSSVRHKKVDDFVLFATTIFIHQEFLKGVNFGGAEGVKVTDQTTDQTTDRVGNNLAEKKILYLIKQNPRITQARIADELEVPKSTVKYYVGKLSKAQKIKREGTVHNGRWIVL